MKFSRKINIVFISYIHVQSFSRLHSLCSVTGIGRALTYTPSLVIVGYYFNKRRGLAVGLATSGVGFGTFMMPPLIEILFNNYGFQGALMILGSISLNFCISGALFRPLELQHKIQRHEM